MRIQLAILCATITFTLLTACGQKGPLILPQEAASQTNMENTEQVKKKTGQDSNE